MMKCISAILFLLVCGQILAESLYVGDAYVPLTADRKAFRVGDSVTVLVVENSRALSSADSQRNFNLGFDVFGTSTNDNEQGTFDFGFDHDKGNATRRAGELTARISVFVKKVDERGLLFVEGKQLIGVNGKEQLIKVSGWLRPNDIAPNNTVLSTRLTNAEIAYAGYKANKGSKKSSSKAKRGGRRR